MPTVQITSEVSTEQLLHSVANLPAHDLEAFITKVLTLRAKLKALVFPIQKRSSSPKSTKAYQLKNKNVGHS